ncbi:sugar ABC transporter permease [Alicyclobacillus cellulosilyticus]|uniref:Sugar ABC transporter permease n=1 Tax=Alicyclobacillus cellulosilyticus TaxID=1003997 RepID=A0A917NK91_9BACL|nr:carbohydrate ABC transporter permease [Alicyclobacillus cellulosilyticus]GGJ04047.1 sugar ABC transporter permease [Alicyclobacillus cellulosilyticus]
MAATEREVQRRKVSFHQRKSAVERTLKGVSFVLLVVISAIMLLPVFIMLSTALKDQQTVFLFPPQWIPRPMHWDNFIAALQSGPFGAYFENTAFYAVVGTLFEVASSSVVAFGFSRYNGLGRDTLFYILLLTMMIPYPAVMIPQFVLFKTLGWTNTYLPLIVPSLFGSAYIIFMLRQFFNGLPGELFEAARIDGCSEWRTFVQIALPLSKPALAAAAIFGFMYRWNDYLAPLIYLNDQDKYTLSVGLAGMTSQFSIVPWHLIMAASLVAVLPPVLIFFFAQRYFIEGIAITGLK